jgi:hypothetical protein
MDQGTGLISKRRPVNRVRLCISIRRTGTVLACPTFTRVRTVYKPDASFLVAAYGQGNVFSLSGMSMTPPEPKSTSPSGLHPECTLLFLFARQN